MNLKKIRKLRSLSREEMSARLKDEGFKILESFWHALQADQLSEKVFFRKHCLVAENRKDDLVSAFWYGPRDAFFTDCYDHRKRRSMFKEEVAVDSWIEEAEKIIRGELTLLGRQVQFDGHSDWHKDPLQGVQWPKSFYAKVTKKSTEKPCDIKYVWELNRHQFLIVLAKAFWLTGNEKYAGKVVEVIRGWIHNNPYNTGVNWTSSLELAVRSLAWIWTLFLCRGSKHFSPEFFCLLAKSVFEHGRYIEQHLSFYSSPYNHLIGEAAALHVIGAVFSGLFKAGNEWQEQGWRILEREVEKQFHDDGCTVEQATFYHHFTLGFYLQSVLLRTMNNKNVSSTVLARLEKALEFSMFIAQPNGFLPMIGDIDNARSLYFNSKHSWDFRGFLGLGALLFQRADFKYQAGGALHEEVLWLCDDTMVERFVALNSRPPANSSRAFSRSGYYISRDSWAKDSGYLCFDCGELGHGLHRGTLPSAAHGHADALSFTLAAFGETFLVDGGFFTYFGALQWHRYFREEAAHNCVTIGEFTQAEYCGRLTWQRVKTPELVAWETGHVHDLMAGKIQYADDVYHVRSIFSSKRNFWLINDFVQANGHPVTTFLHFDPDVEVGVEITKEVIVARKNGVCLSIYYFGLARVRQLRGGERAADGWVADGYGYRQPAWKLVLEWIEPHRLFLPLLIVASRDSSTVGVKSCSFGVPGSGQLLFETRFLRGSENFSLCVDCNLTIRETI